MATKKPTTLVLTLVLTGTAFGQNVSGAGTTASLPTAEPCSALIGSSDQALPDAFRAAVQATVGGYLNEHAALNKRFRDGRFPTAGEMLQLTANQVAEQGYLRRLLWHYGWIGSERGGPVLAHDLAELLSQTADAEVQWCAGQQAIQSSDAADRQAGATLTDKALLAREQPQRYGTVFTRSGRRFIVSSGVRFVPVSGAEAAQMDVHRAELGLPTLAQALQDAQAELPPRVAPPGLARRVKLNEACQDQSTIPVSAFTSPAALNRVLSSAELDRLDDEAARLVEQDQAARSGPLSDPATGTAMGIADADSAAWLRQTLERSGWPSTNRADPELAFNAWLLVQHADATPGLQACALDLLSQQLSTLRERRNFAYLTDRVLTGRGQPQVYGTQVNYQEGQASATPRTLKDPANVGKRRAAVGLEPLEDYLKSFAQR